jgi:hypothetical protein
MSSLWRSQILGVLVVSLAAAGVGCSSGNVSDLSPSTKVDEPELDYRVVPPSPESALFEQAHGGTGKRIIYLNQHGGTYMPGSDDSSSHRSSIVDRAVKIPPYRRSSQSWSELTTCVAKQFSRWNVTVTDVDPGKVPHVEVVVGGMPGAVGLSKGFDGVSPMASNGSIVERAVVYVFAENTPNDARYVCQVAAHEIGHAYGLEHEYLCADPMTYLEGCGQKSFQDKEASCGTYAPAKCRNGGKQNTVLRLNAALGAAKNEPGDDAEPEPPKVSPPAPIEPPAAAVPLPDLPDLAGNDDVALSAPSFVHRGTQLPVVVTGKYLAVFVVWSGPTGAVVRRLHRDDDGDDWKTKLQIAEDASPGARTLQVMAVDAHGTKTASRKVVVE